MIKLNLKNYLFATNQGRWVLKSKRLMLELRNLSLSIFEVILTYKTKIRLNDLQRNLQSSQVQCFGPFFFIEKDTRMLYIVCKNIF